MEFERLTVRQLKNKMLTCQQLVMTGRYQKAKSDINQLSRMDDPKIKMFCAGLHFVGGDIQKSIEALEAADVLNCRNVDSILLLGKCYILKRRQADAALCYHAAIALEPDNQTARAKLAGLQNVFKPTKVNLRQIFQQRGFKGFFEYQAECYKKNKAVGGVPLEVVKGQIPLWTGEKVDRLLIILEQGNGDCIQFLRYMKLAKERCNHLTVAAYPCMMSLIAMNPAIDEVINADIIHTAELADAYSVAAVLPHILDAGYESEPYIHIDGEKLEGFNVGVCWRGSVLNNTDHFRSASYKVLKAFEGFTDITFHSLLVGAESDKAPSWMVRHALDSYEATARVIASLDLVISVDTSVAHLAGAMGKPVWIGLGNPPCWRWETGDTFTEWYKTARLFRNQSDWQTTFNRMAAELENLRS